jgi:hypothetical protein
MYQQVGAVVSLSSAQEESAQVVLTPAASSMVIATVKGAKKRFHNVIQSLNR